MCVETAWHSVCVLPLAINFVLPGSLLFILLMREIVLYHVVIDVSLLHTNNCVLEDATTAACNTNLCGILNICF